MFIALKATPFEAIVMFATGAKLMEVRKLNRLELGKMVCEIRDEVGGAGSPEWKRLQAEAERSNHVAD